MSGTCSGLRELTNQNRLDHSGKKALESPTLKLSVEQRVNRGTAVMDNMRKIMCFLNTEHLKFL